MVAAAFLALALATAEPRPEVSQQITWFYATSLTSGAHFLTSLGFAEVNGTKQASLCRIFHAAPSHYLGVCDTRNAPTCPKGPEGSKDAPPVTYTLVVPGTREVDAWHSHLTALGPRVVRVTAPGHSIRFAVYAFNFYDVLADGLGCYRFEVQAFQDPAWPKPECPPIAVPIPVAVAPPTRPMAVMAAPPTPLLPPPPPPPRRVTLDLFVASKCPDASRCERMLEPVLQAVGELVEVRLSFLGERTAGGGVACLHGESECVGNKAQLCTHKHWPSHVDVDTRGLPAHLNWLLFLRCAAEAEGGRPFNTTAASRIPGNTHACLQRYSVPSATADAIDACVRGAEGATLLAEAVARTHTLCGHHSSRPKTACKSCTMSIEGKPACVLDEGAVYNCTGLASSQAWVALLCDAAARAGWAPSALPLACRAPSMAAGGPSRPGPSWPTVQGHSYASIDPRSSADFAIRYFGATLLSDSRPRCLGKADERPPREVSVRLPRHADFRGGGLELRFVSNPRKPGGAYDTAAHTAAMTLLFGNLSVNTGHHWNQYFDFHLGFYARPSDLIAADLLRDGVPFFTGQSAGVYQSIYVAIPGTGHIVEVLGDWYLPALPPCHVRFSSTDQFCSPKRRRRLRASAPPLPSLDLGVAYSPGDADTNKTTMAGADPRAAIDFAVRYLGGSPVQQHRGPMADGPCTTLAWAEWPDSHEWHVVRYDTADWVSSDGLRPAVPFNVSQLAEYVEALRDLTHGTYDQWLDHREVLSVGNLTELARVLRGDGVPFAVRSRPDEGTCSLLVDLPRNGLAVEVVSRVFDGAWLARRCAANEFDLCAPD